MSIYLIPTIVFVSVFLITEFVLVSLSRSPVSKRLQVIANNRNAASLPKRLGKDRVINNLWTEAGQEIAKRFGLSNPRATSLFRKRLDMAGYHGSQSLSRFWRGLCVSTLITGTVFSFLFYSMHRPIALVILGGIFGALIGFILPNTLLTLKIHKRKKEIISGLPQAIDFLVLCLEAGLSFNAAILKTAQEQERINKAIGAELLFTNQEIQTGKTRTEALKCLADRCAVDDLKALITTMVQTEKLGMSISRNLRIQAKTLRIKKRQRIKQEISKTPVKMVFPLVIFIFPALFFVLLGPAMIVLLRNFPGGR